MLNNLWPENIYVGILAVIGFIVVLCIVLYSIAVMYIYVRERVFEAWYHDRLVEETRLFERHMIDRVDALSKNFELNQRETLKEWVRQASQDYRNWEI